MANNEMRHINSYIDYTLKIDDYLTNSGYTVVVADDGTVEQIIDNTIIKDVSSIMSKTTESDYTVQDDQISYYINEAKAKNTNKNDILEEEIEFYYDLENNKKIAVVTLKIADDLTEFKLQTYTFEI